MSHVDYSQINVVNEIHKHVTALRILSQKRSVDGLGLSAGGEPYAFRSFQPNWIIKANEANNVVAAASQIGNVNCIDNT